MGILLYWDKKRIEWYKRAAEYSDFHSKLACEIKVINGGNFADICDFGCGLGFLALELSKYANKVSAFDVSDEAIEFLNENICANGINNMLANRVDIYSLNPDEINFDTVVMSFFSKPSRDFEFISKFARKNVIHVINNTEKTAKSDNAIVSKREQADTVKSMLENRGYTYLEKHITLEFGQPLKTLEEAYEYLKSYDTAMDFDLNMSKIVEQKIVIGDEIFNYYLPKQKTLCILNIATKK